MAEDPPLSRVTVEREADWLRVQGNTDAALTAALEARLAALPGGARGDTARRLRPKLEEQLELVRERMWKLTKPNLRVNGFNYEDFVETTEPFNESLDREIWSLNTERVRWESAVADKRRKKADEVANLVEDLEERRDAATWRPNADDLAQLPSEPGKPVVRPEDIPAPPRHGEVKGTFETVSSHFSELTATAPQQLARAERVLVVQQELAKLPT
ncbi:hypothetical protein Q8F55_000126 [Vanrija albida]|uniref:Kinetochore protein Spc24 n=1 Tax=Vanrija albida TaxID=181172 RepID=A0ABR3QDD9_9TREE